MVVTGDDAAHRNADYYIIAPVSEIRARVYEIVEENPTPNDKERRDPWARVLGYEADKAVCRRCLRGFEELPESHLMRKHGLTASEYLTRHPDAVLDPAPLGDEEMTTAEWGGWAEEEERC